MYYEGRYYLMIREKLDLFRKMELLVLQTCPLYGKEKSLFYKMTPIPKGEARSSFG
jgi:hypothetical protein